MSLPVDFSPEQYLLLHPDVRYAGMDPTYHYLNHGRFEGRNYKSDGNPLLKKVRGKFSSDGMTSIHNHDFLSEPRFMAAYDRGIQASGLDYQWYWRVHMGLWAARTAALKPGDFVECGVNFGFMSSAIMQDLDWNSTGRTFYLLDTFEGVDDRLLLDEERAGGVVEKCQKWIAEGTYTSSVERVQANFAEWPGARVIQGVVPQTLAEIDAEHIAFLHLDMNCTLPEVAAIEYLWDRLVPGAVVLLDDYAYDGYQPQKEGMDAWAAQRNIPIASLPTGQGLLIRP
ncbi:TylF/MycF/NovP-related O-methyltransferase [Pseudomonas japonica]|uniref:TylF/MycF/NovP-related O-methyltransferase n=1 Tax=Pseudomonas japonica TaxID=256466 RepID=UPI0038161AF9